MAGIGGGVAIAEPTDEEMKRKLKERSSSELLFALSECGVPLKWQHELVVNCGYNCLRLVAGIEETREKVRAAFIDELKVTDAIPNHRLILASLVSSWEVSREQMHREIQLRAETKALAIRRPVGSTERSQMKKLVEDSTGVKMPESSTPSPEYLATKVEEVENDEPLASPLDEVVSMEDAHQASMTQPSAGSNLLHLSEIHLVRRKLKVQLPQTPEALRMRLRTEANCYLMLSARFTNRSWLSGLTQEDFNKWTDHFLGAKCNEMRIARADGSQSFLHPPWSIVLSYEYTCRRRAFYLVREEGMALKDALATAVRDSEIKEISFTSPIALSGRGSQADSTAWGGAKVKKEGKDRAKGGGKGDRKGGGKGGGGKGGKEQRVGKAGNGRRHWKSQTPDGRAICYAFSTGRCTSGECGRVHCCRICFGDHPTPQHPD